MADSDAWTFVKPRSRKNKGKGKIHPPGAQTSSESPLSIKPRTENLRSVDDLEVEYRSVRAQWLESECCTKLRGVVQKQAVGYGQVTKAICLGVGTFDPEDGAWAQKRISFHQLIAFTVMVEELEKVTDSKIKCISQDPIFTESDKGFLTKLGHSVLESPAAYDEIDEDSFLYGVHLYRPVYAASFKSHLPSIFVGTGYDEWEAATMGGLDDIQPMKKMEDDYNKTSFPEDPIPATFFGTSIYWRPQEDTPDDLAKKPQQAESTDSPAEQTENAATQESSAEDSLADKLAATTIK